MSALPAASTKDDGRTLRPLPERGIQRPETATERPYRAHKACVRSSPLPQPFKFHVANHSVLTKLPEACGGGGRYHERDKAHRTIQHRPTTVGQPGGNTVERTSLASATRTNCAESPSRIRARSITLTHSVVSSAVRV